MEKDLLTINISTEAKDAAGEDYVDRLVRRILDSGPRIGDGWEKGELRAKVLSVGSARISVVINGEKWEMSHYEYAKLAKNTYENGAKFIPPNEAGDTLTCELWECKLEDMLVSARILSIEPQPEDGAVAPAPDESNTSVSGPHPLTDSETNQSANG